MFVIPANAGIHFAFSVFASVVLRERQRGSAHLPASALILLLVQKKAISDLPLARHSSTRGHFG
jgi:hypothetical protein